LFDSLTNQQKLNLVDVYVRDVIMNAANTNKSLKAQELARVGVEKLDL